MARLLHADDVGDLPLLALGHHYLLVVDAPDGGLAAAAIVRLEAPRPALRVFAVARGYESVNLEQRVLDLVDEMTEAFGYAA